MVLIKGLGTSYKCNHLHIKGERATKNTLFATLVKNYERRLVISYRVKLKILGNKKIGLEIELPSWTFVNALYGPGLCICMWNGHTSGDISSNLVTFLLLCICCFCLHSESFFRISFCFHLFQRIIEV